MNLRGVLSRGAVVALLFSVVSLGAGATPARALDPLTDTTTVVTVSPSPSLAGQYIEVCATVSAGRGTPAGDVTFTVPSRLSETLALDTGKICFGTTSLLDPGTVTAVYGGSADFAGSEGSAPLIINKAPTTTVVGNLQPTVTGQLTMLCATVTVDPPGAGTVTGSVRFYGPDGFIGAAAPTSSGACLATRAATSGTLIASFTGNPWLLPSGGHGDDGRGPGGNRDRGDGVARPLDGRRNRRGLRHRHGPA